MCVHVICVACMWIYTGVSIFAFMEARGRDQVSCSIFYSFEAGSLAEPGVWLAVSKPQWFCCLYCLQYLGYTLRCKHTWVFNGFWDLNSGHHALSHFSSPNLLLFRVLETILIKHSPLFLGPSESSKCQTWTTFWNFSSSSVSKMCYFLVQWHRDGQHSPGQSHHNSKDSSELRCCSHMWVFLTLG